MYNVYISFIIEIAYSKKMGYNGPKGGLHMSDDQKSNPFAPYELQIDIAERKKLIAPMLAELRKAHNYSQKEVAELLGVSVQAYNGYEKARSEPPLELLVRLSFLYGVSMDIITQRNIFFLDQDGAQRELEKQKAQLAILRQEIEASGQADPAISQFADNMQKLVDTLLAQAKNNQ